MAEISKDVLKKGVKLCTIKEFRDNYCDGVSSQAINYAIENDKIDYIQIGPRVRAIVLNTKSLSYTPNESPKRMRSTMGMKN